MAKSKFYYVAGIEEEIMVVFNRSNTYGILSSIRSKLEDAVSEIW